MFSPQNWLKNNASVQGETLVAGTIAGMLPGFPNGKALLDLMPDPAAVGLARGPSGTRMGRPSGWRSVCPCRELENGGAKYKGGSTHVHTNTPCGGGRVLDLHQQSARRDRQSEPRRFDTIPSQPSA